MVAEDRVTGKDGAVSRPLIEDVENHGVQIDQPLPARGLRGRSNPLGAVGATIKCLRADIQGRTWIS